MQTCLQPLQHRCGIALLPTRLTCNSRLPFRAADCKRLSREQTVVNCLKADSRHPRAAAAPAASVLLAIALTVGNLCVASTASAKSNPIKKSDPYEDLQNIINSRGGSSPKSLLENFQQTAKEAAKLPAEILSPPPQPAQPAPAPAPAPAIPLPITKALPQPVSKAAAASKIEGGSIGLLAGVGALVAAAGFALTSLAGTKSAAPKPNKIKAKIKGGTTQVTKPAPKPSLSLPSLGRKASKEGSKAKGQAKQVSRQASKSTFSLPSLGGKASRVGKTAKIKASSAPQKAKKAVSSGTSFLGTGSTRGKSAPAKGGASLGTRSTRPGSTQKVKVSPGRSATAAQKAVQSGGKSLGDEDSGTTVGAVGVVGLALAVGGLTLSSITSSIGGGGGGGGSAGKAPEPVKQLLDRVPQPLPVTRKAEQAASQVNSKGAPLAPPPSDATKPKVPSGPDLRVPGPPSPSLGATPQLADAPAQAANRAGSKVSEAVPQLANAPSEAASKAAPGQLGGNPAILLGLVALVAGGVLAAKQTQPQSDSKSSGGGGGGPSAFARGQAPQSAEEAAADAKQRAKEAREWIDNWKSKQ